MQDVCHVEAIEKEPTAEELKEIQTAYLTVWGMRCPNCALRVRNGLLSLRGVLDANVDHTLGLAEVVYNPHLCTSSALVDAVARYGADGYHVYSAALAS
ncbi:MAG: heavy-metal-associated domain-containing protein [Chloroflexi bacterium]|nr:heavy-metal-associated domain-containing protein [Chloroflexota bacterium]